MEVKRLLAAGAILAAGTLVMSGCAAPDRGGDGAGGPGITVSWNDPFFSWNTNTTPANAASNAIVVMTANSGFFTYDNVPEAVPNEQFGTVEKLSDDPLTVKYTINEGVTWSDGAPMDAADLLLVWASQTTHRSAGEVPEPEVDDDGNVTNQDAIDAAAEAGVFWNTNPGPGLQLDLVEKTPTIGDDGRSMTIEYSKPYADWQSLFKGDSTSIAAHGVVQLAYPGEYDDPKAAKDAFVKAVNDNDTAFLGPVATAFRTDYDYKSMPEKPQQYLSNGPYVLSDLVEDQYAVLTLRDDYTWGPKPAYKTITIKVIPDAQAAVTALQNGEIQIAYGQPTVDIIQQLEGLEGSGIEWESALEGTYEHVDLQVTNGGPFDPATYGGDEAKAKAVREAFLLSIPRQEIVDKLITPLAPDATTRDSNFFLPGADGYDESVAASGIDRYTGDVEAAKAKLAEAGVDSPSVRFLTAKNNPRRQQELALIQANAEAAGFTFVDASAEDWSTVLSTQPNAYDAALFGWQSEALGFGETSPNYITGGTNNYFGWSVPELDAKLQQLDTTTDPAEVLKVGAEAEKLVYDQSWTVPIFQFPGVLAWSSEVTGVQPGFLSPSYFWSAPSWAPAS